MLSVNNAAVTDLDCTTIIDFSKFVIFRGVLFYQGKESVFNIGADVFAEWGVVPEYVVPMSVFLFVSYGWFVSSVPVSAFVLSAFWYGGAA